MYEFFIPRDSQVDSHVLKAQVGTELQNEAARRPCFLGPSGFSEVFSDFNSVSEQPFHVLPVDQLVASPYQISSVASASMPGPQ